MNELELLWNGIYNDEFNIPRSRCWVVYQFS